MSTIPSTLAPVVNSYTPSVQSPAFSSPINEVLTVTTFTTGAQTLTAAQAIGGLVVGSPSAGANYTLPSAQSLIPLIQGASVGSTFRLAILNKGAGAITLVAGTGCTLAVEPSTIAATSAAEILIQVTSMGDVNAVGATYTAYGNF